jgi:hypothetical protein
VGVGVSRARGLHLQVYASLQRHRKTLRLAALLGVDRQKALGILLDLWWWGLGNATVTGTIEGCTPAELALAVEWSGRPEDLVSALTLSGWLLEVRGGLQLHEWDEYGGRVIEQHAADRDRWHRRRPGESPTDKPRSIPPQGGQGEARPTTPSAGVPPEFRRSSDVDETRRDEKKYPPTPRKRGARRRGFDPGKEVGVQADEGCRSCGKPRESIHMYCRACYTTACGEAAAVEVFGPAGGPSAPVDGRNEDSLKAGVAR